MEYRCACGCSRKTAVFILSLLFFAGILVFRVRADFIIPGGRTDVLITVTSRSGYRYSCDILYRSMVFTYNLRAVEYNTETGECYISYGEWRQSGMRTNTADITVINHADTPIRVTAHVRADDFVKSGVYVETTGLDGTRIAACDLTADEVKIDEGSMTLSIIGVPALAQYAGRKVLYVTVDIVPVSGYATNGDYVVSPFE